MLIALILLVILLLVVLIRSILYRRQIREICRQLSFLHDNDTNLGVTSFMGEDEIIELVNCINRISKGYRAKELEYLKKDKKIKNVLASVSHDIRTPLTSLKGYFQLYVQEKDDSKKAEYEGIIDERIDTLTELLEEMFTYTRLSNDEYEIELEHCDMTAPVLETLFSFYNQINEMEIEIELEIDETTRYIKGNNLAIKRMISNIIKNALVHGAGDLAIKYQADEPGDNITFSCTNSVFNPDEIDVNQVFDRFYKADKARSKNSTGLGLAIAKSYVDRMNGSITACLEGNIFSVNITLPIDK